MNSGLSIVPLFAHLILIPAIRGSIVKLSARILNNSGITWKGGFLFGLMVGFYSLIFHMIIRFSGASLPFILGIAIALFGNLIIGGCFFSTRGTTANGKLLGWSGAVKLAGLSYVIMFIIVMALNNIWKMFLAAVMP